MAHYDTFANVNEATYGRHLDAAHRSGNWGSLYRSSDGERVRAATKEEWEAQAKRAMATCDPDALVDIPGVGLCELRENIAFPGR